MIRTVPAFALLLLLPACGGDVVTDFGEPRRVPQENRSIVWEAGSVERFGIDPIGAAKGAGAGAPSGGGLNIVSNTPSGWEELPATSQFRNAVWRVKGQPETDCYLTVGVGGGVAMNLRRWYGQQFGNSEVPKQDALPQIPFANRIGRLAEIEGTFAGKADYAALIAFFEQEGAVTSLKFTGPAAVVRGNKEPFLELAKSIRIASASPNPQAPPIQKGQGMPAGHPDIGQSEAAPVNAAPFTAKAPDDWQAKAGSRRLLHYQFGGNSELYVGTIGGGLKQSLDIWRGEIGQDTLSDAEFAAMPNTLFLGDDAVLMDLSGKFRGMTGVSIEAARMLVAARLDGATITFCKLVGPADEVAPQRDAFVTFCGSIRRAK